MGRPGRKAVRELLPVLLSEYRPQLIVANGENAAGGNGITPDIAHELFAYGVDILTMGNHVWDKKEGIPLLEEDPRVIRPANYPPGTPGRGWTTVKTSEDIHVGIINLSGRVFLAPLDCPFRLGRDIAEELRKEVNVILVDFHAEATSEKVAMGWHLDGMVSAVMGTHTHIQTADARVLPGGTAYITDVGMTGPRNSILGVKTELVLQKFITQLPVRFEVAGGDIQLEAVVIEIDSSTGRAVWIKRIQHYSY